MTFAERLQKAAAHAQVRWGQTDVARSLGISKQTVDRWFNGGEPKPAQLYLIADKWGVDPRWLATEKGQMLPGQIEASSPAVRKRHAMHVQEGAVTHYRGRSGTKRISKK